MDISHVTSVALVRSGKTARTMRRPVVSRAVTNDHVVPMPLLEGNLVNTRHCERRQRFPIDARRHPALDRAEDDIVAGIFLLADVLDGAIDQLHQEVMFVGRRVQRFGHIPAQALGRRRVIVARGTAEAFRADLDVDYIAQDR